MTEEAMNAVLKGLQVHREEVDKLIVDLGRTVDGLKKLGFLNNGNLTELARLVKQTFNEFSAPEKEVVVPVPFLKDVRVEASPPLYVTEWVNTSKYQRQKQRAQTIDNLAKKYNVDPKEVESELRVWLSGGKNSLYYNKKQNNLSAAQATSEEIPPVIRKWAEMPRENRFGAASKSHKEVLAHAHGITLAEFESLRKYWFDKPGATSRFYKRMKELEG